MVHSTLWDAIPQCGSTNVVHSMWALTYIPIMVHRLCPNLVHGPPLVHRGCCKKATPRKNRPPWPWSGGPTDLEFLYFLHGKNVPCHFFHFFVKFSFKIKHFDVRGGSAGRSPIWINDLQRFRGGSGGSGGISSYFFFFFFFFKKIIKRVNIPCLPCLPCHFLVVDPGKNTTSSVWGENAYFFALVNVWLSMLTKFKAHWKMRREDFVVSGCW